MKSALIFGVNGQDGSYLSEFLLEKGYQVNGVIRRASVNNTKERMEFSLNNPNFILHEGDITDASSIIELVEQAKPDEVYNLAAQSHVGTSFKQPAATWNINAGGVQNILEVLRKKKPDARFYQASTSEMFGSILDADGCQRETTELSPNSPYAISKVAAHHAVRLYREAYGMFACSGILFNHESPRRGEGFVTRKISKYVANLKRSAHELNGENWFLPKEEWAELIRKAMKQTGPLKLGNLDAQRDWGFAGDYIEAMWLMLQQDKPEDYVVATGETYSVRSLLDHAFKHIGIDDWSDIVVVDPAFIRPYEVPLLRGDATRAREKLGWKPKVNFEQLVKMMVDND
jgi:GDPmannose 4,6-dehydratase